MYSLLWNTLQSVLNLIQIWRKQGRKWVTTIGANRAGNESPLSVMQTNSWGIQCRSVWELSANDHWLVNQMVLKINTNSIIHYLCFELEVSKWFLSFQINPKPIMIKCSKIWFLTKIIYKCFTKQCFVGPAFWFQSNKNQFLILNTNSRQI